MNSRSCFWSFLSKDDFRFLYVPISVGEFKSSINGKSMRDILLTHTLFDIMHPSEVELAKADLTRFLKLNTLAGSVTRCRLLSAKNIGTDFTSTLPRLLKYPVMHENSARIVSAPIVDSVDWNITDLVMYTVTESTVLVLFHNFDLKSCYTSNSIEKIPRCNQDCQAFVHEDVSGLIKMLQREQANLEQKHNIHNEYKITQIQVLRIIDRSTNECILFSPYSYPQQQSFMEMAFYKTSHVSLKEFRSSSYSSNHSIYNDSSSDIDIVECSRHFYASSKIKLIDQDMCDFQRILIPYGNIAFESLKLYSINNLTSFYYHEQSSSPVLNTPLPQIKIPSILTPNNSEPFFKPILYQSDQDEKCNNTSNKLHDVFTPSLSIQNKYEVENIHTFENKNQRVNTKKNIWPNDQIISKDSLNNPYVYTNDFSLVGSSMFQKFRIRKYEPSGNISQQSSLSSIEKKRGSNIFYTPSEIGIASKPMKICSSCNTSNSPEWRRGPDGNKTLCNACGLRYSRFKSKQWNNSMKSNFKQ